MRKLFMLLILGTLLLPAVPSEAKKKPKDADFHNAKSWTTYRIVEPRDTYFIGIKDKETRSWACYPYEKKRQAGKVLILKQDLFSGGAYGGYVWIYGRLYTGTGREDFVTGRGWYRLHGGELVPIVPIGEFDAVSYYDSPMPEVPLFECQKSVDGIVRCYLVDGYGRTIVSGATLIESITYPDGHTWRFAWDEGMKHAIAINHLGERVFGGFSSVEPFGRTEYLQVLSTEGSWGIIGRDGSVAVPCICERDALPAAWAAYKKENNLL